MLIYSIDIAVSTLHKYLISTLSVFIEEFTERNPVIFFPKRRERDKKNILLKQPSGSFIRLSVIIDGTYGEILMPDVKGIMIIFYLNIDR